MNSSRTLVVGLTILATVFMAGCQSDSDEAALTFAPHFTSFEEAKAAATDKNQPILVEFYSDECIWCVKLDSAVFSDTAGINYFSNKVILAKVNAKVDTTLAKTYKISGYPTAVLVDKDGVEIDRVVGFYEVADYIEILENYRKGIGTLADLVEQAQGNEDRLLYHDIADKYKFRGGVVEAEEWYNKTIRLGEPADSVSGECRFAIADMFLRAKEYDRSIEEFRKIVDDFKGQDYSMTAEMYIGYTFDRKGDTAAAIEAFEQFIEQHPEAEDAEYAQTEINRLKGIAEEEQSE